MAGIWNDRVGEVNDWKNWKTSKNVQKLLYRGSRCDRTILNRRTWVESLLTDGSEGLGCIGSRGSSGTGQRCKIGWRRPSARCDSSGEWKIWEHRASIPIGTLKGGQTCGGTGKGVVGIFCPQQLPSLIPQWCKMQAGFCLGLRQYSLGKTEGEKGLTFDFHLGSGRIKMRPEVKRRLRVWKACSPWGDLKEEPRGVREYRGTSTAVWLWINHLQKLANPRNLCSCLW